MDRKTYNELDRAWTEFSQTIKHISDKEKRQKIPFGGVAGVSFISPGSREEEIAVTGYSGNIVSCMVTCYLILNELKNHIDTFPKSDREKIMQAVRQELADAVKNKMMSK